jgi:lipopolysaccharide transport system ATP-binding protein
MMSVAVEFNNVTKYYPLYHLFSGGIKSFLTDVPTRLRRIRRERFTALEQISFNIGRGESVAIIGRNGAGKSTILGLIAGVIKPSGGSVQVNEPVSPLLELGGGFHPDLTGSENVILNGVLMGLSRDRVREKLAAILDFAELGDFVHQPIRTYSSGMLARLGFSVITQIEPKLLLIDEVLAVGDDGFRKKCYDLIERFQRQGATIVFVSHSASDVSRLCDRAIWIDNHRLRADGDVRCVLAEYQSSM